MKLNAFPATLLLLAAAACSPAAEPVAEPSPPNPLPAEAVRTVAVELFTSQGCSSCPPADAVLERLGADPNLVVLSRPVTYWDWIGWRDTFARPENDALQSRYVARLGARSKYTPQAVVQGRAELVGSDEPALRARIAEARRGGGAQLKVEDGRISLSGQASAPAEVRLLALRSQAQVPIGRGENRNRTVTYTNVVLDERLIGQWRGGAAEFPIPIHAFDVEAADAFAVIVQEQDAGAILQAAYVRPPGS